MELLVHRKSTIPYEEANNPIGSYPSNSMGRQSQVHPMQYQQPTYGYMGGPPQGQQIYGTMPYGYNYGYPQPQMNGTYYTNTMPYGAQYQYGPQMEMNYMNGHYGYTGQPAPYYRTAPGRAQRKITSPF